MTAKEAPLLPFLQVTQQFIIPIYQRTYSWSYWECLQLWNDILRVGSSGVLPSHFVGSVVYIRAGGDNAITVPQRLLIDGQQRLTTISLLLSELAKALKAGGPAAEQKAGITSQKISNYYLVNPEEEGDLRPKLVLTQRDKETLIRRITQKDPPADVSPRISENAEFFNEQLKASKLDLGVVYRGLQKLMIVDVALEKGKDNPQLIFESLNSTGLDLSQADLIRNFVLMGLETEQQNELYNIHWHPMEKLFGENYTKYFDWFMRDYLTVKNGVISNIGFVYKEFKTHVRKPESGTIPEVVANVHGYSQYYVKLTFPDTETDVETRAAFDDLRTLRVDVANPFLMEAYADCEDEILTHSEFLALTRLIESYVFRRAICGIPTNSLNKTFAGLSREIDKKNYLQSSQAVLLLKDSYRRFPADDEFRRELAVKDVYNTRTLAYLLDKLENMGRKERVKVADYTIEHILPQNEKLKPEWRECLGPNWSEIQKRYLHTLGNLTLTGYNSEYSDRPFLEKRDKKDKDGNNIGFAGSPIRLNTELATLKTWNEEEIKKRSSLLSDRCIKLWPYPIVSKEVLELYRKARGQVFSAIDHPYIQPEILELLDYVRKRLLNLDSSVTEEVTKEKINYIAVTRFVSVELQKQRLEVKLRIPYEDLHIPAGAAERGIEPTRRKNGEAKLHVNDTQQLDDAMVFIKQAYEHHADNGN